ALQFAHDGNAGQGDKYEAGDGEQATSGHSPPLSGGLAMCPTLWGGAQAPASDQALNFCLIRALTAPMSARPCACDFTIPITLPMSFTEAAPVEAMACAIKASISASDICAGR